MYNNDYTALILHKGREQELIEEAKKERVITEKARQSRNNRDNRKNSRRNQNGVR